MLTQASPARRALPHSLPLGRGPENSEIYTSLRAIIRIYGQRGSFSGADERKLSKKRSRAGSHTASGRCPPQTGGARLPCTGKLETRGSGAAVRRSAPTRPRKASPQLVAGGTAGSGSPRCLRGGGRPLLESTGIPVGTKAGRSYLRCLRRTSTRGLPGRRMWLRRYQDQQLSGSTLRAFRFCCRVSSRAE